MTRKRTRDDGKLLPTALQGRDGEWDDEPTKPDAWSWHPPAAVDGQARVPSDEELDADLYQHAGAGQ
jgi:hypothetical protein